MNFINNAHIRYSGAPQYAIQRNCMHTAVGKLGATQYPNGLLTTNFNGSMNVRLKNGYMADQDGRLCFPSPWNYEIVCEESEPGPYYDGFAVCDGGLHYMNKTVGPRRGLVYAINGLDPVPFTLDDKVCFRNRDGRMNVVENYDGSMSVVSMAIVPVQMSFGDLIIGNDICYINKSSLQIVCGPKVLVPEHRDSFDVDVCDGILTYKNNSTFYQCNTGKGYRTLYARDKGKCWPVKLRIQDN